MVGSSYDQKPYRRSMMQTWGATRAPLARRRRPSPGRANAGSPTGSLGIAISEAVEVAAQNEDTNYSLGSVLNHVLLHQTVIGQESIAQMELAGDTPDVIVGCVGGGSNFAGLAYPWLRRKLRSGSGPRFLAAEPAACPTLTQGVYAYDFGDTAGLTPLMPMYTLGHGFVPPPVHAGGLRYHGDAPSLCALVRAGAIEARAFRQNETFEAALRFARSEGIIPAPEPAHAIRAVIEEAEAARESGEERVILFGLCGHGHFDLAAYDAYLAGTLEDPEFSEADRDAALAALPGGRAESLRRQRAARSRQGTEGGRPAPASCAGAAVRIVARSSVRRAGRPAASPSPPRAAPQPAAAPIALDRPPPRRGVVDDRRGVVAPDAAARGLLLGVAHRPRLGEPVVGHAAQLGAPAAHVAPVGVEAALLGHRVEEALEVRARDRCPSRRSTASRRCCWPRRRRADGP